jgi:hypothetical protein
MKVLMRFLYPAALIALAVGICGELAARLNPWVVMAIWADAMAVLCSAAAWGLKNAPMGTITWRNKLAGYLLPWGYKLGRGKLVPMTLAAWVIWVLIGLGTVILTAWPAGAAREHPYTAVMTFLSWIVLGALAVRQIGLIPTFGSHSGRMSLLQSVAVVVALLVASAVLWLTGRAGWALLVAGGPIAFVGGGYGLFLGVMLTVGRKARWN